MKVINLRKASLFSSLILLATMSFWSSQVRAEGSKDMVEDGGDRPYTEWATGTTAGIIRQTLLQVYVEAGETVYFGSSVPSSANAPDDIVYRSPNGGQDGSCNVDESSGFGLIDTVEKENAGPETLDPNGYIPCSFVATETGIYEFEMRAPSTTGNPPGDQLATEPFSTGSNQNSGVSAWDITVADSSGTVQEGRVFTKYIALNMGSNNAAPNLRSDFFIQTKDGYRYRTDMNEVDPFGFIFFSNNRGFIDQTDNSTLYHSAVANDNSLTQFEGNVEVQRPDLPDTATNITHLIFFNQPNPNALAFLGIPTTPSTPAQPQNFQFVGGNGGSGNQTPENVGGNFTFDSTSEGSYQIIIDTNSPSDDPSNGEFNPDGIFDPSVDTVLENPASVGTNVVPWDGRDNDNNLVPPRDGNITPYDARIILRVGEYHFPMLDAETNSKGFIIELLNAPVAFPSGLTDTEGNAIDEFTIYYDDSNYTTADGTTVSLDGSGATSPRNAARGVNSNTGQHEFGNNYGNQKGIDTWTFFPSQPTNTPLVVTPTNQANVEGTKSVQFLTDADGNGQVTVGDRVQYRITYANTSGSSNATDFVISDDLPPQLTFKSVSIVSQTSGNTINLNPAYRGSGALTESGTLRIDDTIEIVIEATINDANNGNAIENQARATFSTPDSSSTTGTVVTDADSNGGTSQSPSEGESFSQQNDNGDEEGNNPSNTTDDDPTIITVVKTPPQVLLVKRITQVNGRDLTGFDGNDNDSSDDNMLWPTPKAQFLRGAVSQEVKPGDEIEYTIYYLSSGGQAARNVTICDLISEHQTYIRDSFDSPGGGTNLGIAALIRETNPLPDPLTPNQYLTNLDGDDEGSFFDPGRTPPSECKKPGSFESLEADDNTNGLVVVDVVTNPTTLPPATSPGDPPESYGFIRFRTKVD